MNPEEKEKLASLKPISKIDKFEMKLKGMDKKEGKTLSKIKEVVELPECAVCGEVARLQKCPCNLCYYCGIDLQKIH